MGGLVLVPFEGCVGACSAGGITGDLGLIPVSSGLPFAFLAGLKRDVRLQGVESDDATSHARGGYCQWGLLEAPTQFGRRVLDASLTAGATFAATNGDSVGDGSGSRFACGFVLPAVEQKVKLQAATGIDDNIRVVKRGPGQDHQREGNEGEGDEDGEGTSGGILSALSARHGVLRGGLSGVTAQLIDMMFCGHRVVTRCVARSPDVYRATGFVSTFATFKSTIPEVDAMMS